MRILHILSNHKWTERAEPVVDLALAQREAGMAVEFVCGRWPGPPAPGNDEYSVELQARAKGLEPVVMRMNKHFRLSGALRDVPELRRLAEGVDVVHVHMLNAHFLAALACRRMRKRPLIVRSSYRPGGPIEGRRSRWLCRRHTDGLIVITPDAARDASERFGLPPGSVEVIEPGIDLRRFRPGSAADARRGFGLEPRHFVVGMVTRLRSDRRIDAVLEAFAQMAPGREDARLLLAGQGEDEASVRGMIADLGLESVVQMPGYCRGERLVQAYSAMDVLVYPSVGTDKSARTVREAMACGVPVIAAREGFVTSLVEDGVTGCLAGTGPEAIRAALDRLAADRGALARMRAAALNSAAERFSVKVQAEKTTAFYGRLARSRKV